MEIRINSGKGSDNTGMKTAFIRRFLFVSVFVASLFLFGSCSALQYISSDQMRQEYDPNIDGYVDDYDDYYYDYMGY